jgi:hypothetical protein
VIAVSGAMNPVPLDHCSNQPLAADQSLPRSAEAVDVVGGGPDGERGRLVTVEILRFDGCHTARRPDPNQPGPSRPRERRSTYAC